MMCRCESFRPGMTVRPPASMTRVPAFLCLRICAVLPTAVILPPSMATAWANSPSFTIVATLAFVTIRPAVKATVESWAVTSPAASMAACCIGRFIVFLKNAAKKTERPMQQGATGRRGRAAALLLLDGFDREGQLDVVADIRGVLARVELGALDGGRGVGAAGILLRHRVRHALERRHFQLHWLGHALDGQVAVDRGQGVAVEVELGRLVRDGRVLGRVEEVGALDMAVEGVIARVDGLGVDGHVDGTGLGGAVEDDLALGAVEAAFLRRVAEVAVGETGVGVRIVDDVGLRRGMGGQGGGHRGGGNGEGDQFFHVGLSRMRWYNSVHRHYARGTTESKTENLPLYYRKTR